VVSFSDIIAPSSSKSGIGDLVQNIAGNTAGGLANTALGLLGQATTIELPKSLGGIASQLGLPKSTNLISAAYSLFGVDATALLNGGFNKTGVIPAAVSLEQYNRKWDPLQNLMFSVTATHPKLSVGKLTVDYIKDVHLQLPKMEMVTQVQGTVHIAFPKDENKLTLDIAYYEDTDANILKMYSRWYALMYNRNTGVYGVPNDYKGDISVNIIDYTGTEIVKFQFAGVVPISISGYNFTPKGDQIITPTITYSVDKLLFNI
jgi:hypothetical protein